MVQWLWAGTTAAVATAAFYAFSRTRDPFHPAIILAPSMAFVYGIWPFLLNQGQELTQLFDEEKLAYVGTLYFCALLSFYAGLSRFPSRRVMRGLITLKGYQANPFNLNLSAVVRRRMLLIAMGLGLVALTAYAAMLYSVGGLIAAYSVAKGGGVAGSGYVGEAILLSFPAILLLGLSRQGSGRIRLIDLFLALLIALPHLLQGTLGGRRGPLFLVLAVLFLAWVLARGKPPPLLSSLIGFGTIGFLVLLVASQRQFLFLGSGGDFDISRLFDLFLTPEDLITNDYVAGVSTVLVNDYHQDFSWGSEHLVNLLIRPIPRQLWPDKYEDAADLLGYRVVEGGGEWDYFAEVLGFSPPKGSAVGFIANLYSSFSWGVLLAMFLFGWSLAVLWKRHRLRGGLWTVLYGQAMILSVYLPTQSFSAFYQRFLIMTAISVLVFRFIGKTRPSRA